METIAGLLTQLTSAGGSATVVGNRLALKIPRSAEAIGRTVLARRAEALIHFGETPAPAPPGAVDVPVAEPPAPLPPAMTATQAMIEAYRAGASLSVEASWLRWAPAGILPPGVRGALIANAAEIVFHLTTPLEYRPDMELTVIASTDPSAVGGRWVGPVWFPPTPAAGRP